MLQPNDDDDDVATKCVECVRKTANGMRAQHARTDGWRWMTFRFFGDFIFQ